jgi:hypothetical protein
MSPNASSRDASRAEIGQAEREWNEKVTVTVLMITVMGFKVVIILL